MYFYIAVYPRKCKQLLLEQMWRCMPPFVVLSSIMLWGPLVLGNCQLCPATAASGEDDHLGRLQTYIVHVQKPHNLVFGSRREREDWHKSFLPSNALGSGQPRLVYSYEHAIGGFAARLTPEEVEAMEGMEGFLFAQPIPELKTRTTYTPQYLGLTRSGQLWDLADRGRGRVIGVLELGFRSGHESFKDDDMTAPPQRWKGACPFEPENCNKKLIGNKIFNASSNFDPSDSNAAHGTNVACVAAGNTVPGANFEGRACGSASGAAPRAHLAFYSVADGADALMAIDQAIADGVDVLSISIGVRGQSPFYQNVYDIATLSATTHGVFVSSAAGNSGPMPGGMEDNTPWTLSVGASTTDRDNGIHAHPEVPYFSARGPSSVNNGILKPDILGPGVDILVASPEKSRGFVLQSGTSLACPHLSGIAAQLRSLNPDWSPAMIKSSIMTTANWLNSAGLPIADQTGNPASLFATGSGQVNASRAADPGLVYNIRFGDYVQYVCGLGYTSKQVNAVLRRPVDCAVTGAISGEELNYPSFSIKANSTPKVITRTVTNVGRARESYTLALEQPLDVWIDVFPRTLDFYQVGQQRTYTVTVAWINPERLAKEVEEGQLTWVSPHHRVRSPISVTFERN